MAESTSQAITSISEKVGVGSDEWSVRLHAPDWSMQGTTRYVVALLVRLIIAAILIALSAGAGYQVLAEMPGEQAIKPLITSALETVAAAEETQQDAQTKKSDVEAQIKTWRSQLREARSTLKAAKRAKSRASDRADKISFVPAIEKARGSAERAKDRIRQGERLRKDLAATIVGARTDKTRAQELASSAGVLTGGDLGRVVAVGAWALLAVVAAVAMLAPRSAPNAQFTAVNGAGTLPPNPPPSTGGGGSSTQTAADPGSSQTTPSGPDEASFAKSEPVVGQSILAAIVIAAGLWGIQLNEGWTEEILNFVLPIVPILGAFLVRRYVWPVAKLTSPTGTKA